jgi:hypothetical protein
MASNCDPPDLLVETITRGMRIDFTEHLNARLAYWLLEPLLLLLKGTAIKEMRYLHFTLEGTAQRR